MPDRQADGGNRTLVVSLRSHSDSGVFRNSEEVCQIVPSQIQCGGIALAARAVTAWSRVERRGGGPQSPPPPKHFSVGRPAQRRKNLVFLPQKPAYKAENLMSLRCRHA